jgi:hypothetical protein
MTSDPASPQAARTASEIFYSGAVRRILRLIPPCAAPLVIGFGVGLGWPAALGGTVGSALAWESFRELAKAVNSLAERITERQSREKGARVVARFLLRYVWIGLSAYVIFKISQRALYGFLGGLCVPVAAMLCEAGYEAYVALRRGI